MDVVADMHLAGSAVAREPEGSAEARASLSWRGGGVAVGRDAGVGWVG